MESSAGNGGTPGGRGVRRGAVAALALLAAVVTVSTSGCIGKLTTSNPSHVDWTISAGPTAKAVATASCVAGVVKVYLGVFSTSGVAVATSNGGTWELVDSYSNSCNSSCWGCSWSDVKGASDLTQAGTYDFKAYFSYSGSDSGPDTTDPTVTVRVAAASGSSKRIALATK